MRLLADVLTSANSWNSEQPLLSYTVPPEIETELRAGQLVAVPYGDRLVEGIVWKLWEDDGTEQQEAEQQNTGRPQGSPLHFSQATGDIQNVGATLAVAQLDSTLPPKDEFNHLRPISTILDPEPALLPHQRALAEWMAEYYVTPLAQVATKMLPPGLMQRSKVVLHLINSEELATYSNTRSTHIDTSPRTYRLTVSRWRD